MNILCLTLKKQWFDMIEQGIKLEEYREIKPYWIKRLIHNKEEMSSQMFDEMCNVLSRPLRSVDDILDFFECEFKHFDNIVFSNGYGHNVPKCWKDCYGITIGIGKKEWGAPDKPVFIIKLSK